jgi:predicted dehydrogenase
MDLKLVPQAEPTPSERGQWDAFYPAVREAIVGGGAMPVDAADAVAVLRVLDAARASAETGQAVRL